MDILFILKEVISWLIPIVGTAIMAILVKPALKAQKRGQELIEQEEWDTRSQKLVDRIDGIEKGLKEDKAEIIAKIESLSCGGVDEKARDMLSTILIQLQANNEEHHKRFDELELRNRSMDDKNTQAFIQIYQRDLIVDGKTYIDNGFWTPNQKANFEKRYKQYKEWGGNGDIEPWYERLQRLPIHFPDITEFIEK